MAPPLLRYLVTASARAIWYWPHWPESKHPAHQRGACTRFDSQNSVACGVIHLGAPGTDVCARWMSPSGATLTVARVPRGAIGTIELIRSI
jgi:hypothetical protein